MDTKTRKTVRNTAISATVATALVVAVPFITKREGLSLTAYQDVGKVWTICYGETLGVQPGERKSAEQCREMAVSRIGEFMGHVDAAIQPDVSPDTLAAHTSFAYNIGVSGYSRSQTLRLTNARRFADGCRAMMNWITAGGKDCRIRKNNCYGLVTRREDEVNLCLKGLAEPEASVIIK